MSRSPPPPARPWARRPTRPPSPPARPSSGTPPSPRPARRSPPRANTLPRDKRPALRYYKTTSDPRGVAAAPCRPRVASRRRAIHCRARDRSQRGRGPPAGIGATMIILRSRGARRWRALLLGGLIAVLAWPAGQTLASWAGWAPAPPAPVRAAPAPPAPIALNPVNGKIAFASDRDGNNEIYVMNPDGSNPVRLTNNPANDTDPAWSPDGTRLAFDSNRSGSLEIWAM